ncbi:MAG: hypothetical protein KJ621_00870 [Proteobacteria bacterium]|nr:hypothetical protein [Pseudomonadota bacterium]
MKRVVSLVAAVVLLCCAPALAFDAKDLAKFLPDTLGGLKAIDKANTMSMTIKDKAMNTATRRYAGGSDRVIVMIRSGAYAAQMAAMIKMKIAMDTPTMTMKSINVKGFPGQLVINKKRKTLSVRVHLGVTMVIAASEKTVDPAAALKVVGDMDLKGLAALK